MLFLQKQWRRVAVELKLLRSSSAFFLTLYNGKLRLLLIKLKNTDFYVPLSERLAMKMQHTKQEEYLNKDYQEAAALFNGRYTPQYLYYLNRTRRFHYRKAEIPKKNGQMRKILIPDNNLKNIQRLILKNHLMHIPVSDYATAYQKGTSLVQNAGAHLNKRIVLKMDISDFFGSITEDAVYLAAFNKKYFKPAAGKLLASLCCYNGAIVQGSPSSPALANIVMKNFDEKIGHWCESHSISYTRYSDDMIFSGDFNKALVIGKVTNILLSMNMFVNEKKTTVIPKNKRQNVTGIVVNEKLQVASSYRREIRKEIYYCNKYGIKNHLEHNSLTVRYNEKSYINILLGKINFVLNVNPNDKEFIEYKKILKNIKA